MSNTQTLSSLIPGTPVAGDLNVSVSNPTYVKPVSTNNCNTLRFSRVILIYIILAVLIWIIFYLWCPGMVQKQDINGNPTNSCDPISALVTALILALIITILIVIIYWAFSKCRKL